MKRSERLEKINVINAGLENLAGAKLAGVYEEYSSQINQLEQLKIYKDDYAEQLKQKMQDNISPQELRDYKFFFSSIENAIHQQENVVTHLQTRLEQCQEEWLERRNEVKKINIAGENIKQTEALADARREQKISDELGMSMSNPFRTRISH